jgi:hypothetical protein
MFNKNLFSCIKSSPNDLENSVINLDQQQQSSASIKNKLKKKINSSLGRKRNKKICLEKSTIKTSFNDDLKDSGLNLTEKNLLSSTTIFNSSNYYSIDFLHEGFYSDNSEFSDDSFMSLETTKFNSSISSMESIVSSKNNNDSTLNDINSDIDLKFHPLISSSRTSLIINQQVKSDFALSRKLTPFKTSSRKSLLNESKRVKLTLDEPISSFNEIEFNNLCKCYSIDIYDKLYDSNNFDSSINSNNISQNKYSSTLLSIKNESKLKCLNFSEFLKNEIYNSYF